MTAYYSENDPYVAQWLRNLIANGLIAPGEVDERSIADVRADDLRGFVQCHFFAGLGGWSCALRLAGWPDDRPVWTGSCPCQPGSVAGKQEGFDDPRHLWPCWRPLVAERHPSTIFGEQVAGWSDWLGLVRGDLEQMGYAVGCLPIEAASAGADHFRDRYWFVANATGGEQCGVWEPRAVRGPRELSVGGYGPGDHVGPLAHDYGLRPQEPVGEPGDAGPQCAASAGNRVRDVVNDPSLGWGEGWTESEFRRRGFTAAVASIEDRQYVECPDGKWRRLPPPRVRWLGNGIPARVAKLRAIGNAIDPRPAAAFITAAMGVILEISA